MKSLSPLTKTAVSATLHCLTGCAIGEVIGLVAGTAWHLPNAITISISIALAFLFGYSLSILPLLKTGFAPKAALLLVLAADTLSITTMEIIDNLIMIIIPDAMNAGLDSLLFWLSLAVSLIAAFIAAFPVNRWLIAKGKGHALIHDDHSHNA